ncbi:MAG: signal peptidase I [Clostridia bacterium]|nr:signal peptidase I [Clostridia bacterium]
MDKKNITKEIIEWILCFIIAIVIALLVRYFVGTPTVVKNVSMNPTLVEGQRLWLNRFSIKTKEKLKRGDIVTFESPTTLEVKNYDLDLDNAVAKYDKKIDGIFNKFTYNVLEINKTSFIKRVIGLPGEYIEIKDGSVYIDGQKQDETYLPEGVVTDMKKGGLFNNFTVPEGTYFLLGDNRTESTDSRCFGCIPYEKIESKVAFRFWPFNLFGNVK